MILFLKKTTPINATEELKGKIWTKIIEREELDEAETSFDVLSSSYNQDNTLNIRVHSDEKPGDGFDLTEAQLDDVYFIALKEGEAVLA